MTPASAEDEAASATLAPSVAYVRLLVALISLQSTHSAPKKPSGEVP